MTAPVDRTDGLLRRVGKRAVRSATDRGWFGRTPLQAHAVICGWPRSGSTLLEQLVHLCVDDVWTWPTEVPALQAAADAHRDHRFMCTKDPRDIGRVHAVRHHYGTHRGRAVFLVTVRDPRAVLTSTHDGYPPSRGYYCEVPRWRAVWRLVMALRDDADVVLVPMERLVTDPDRVQHELAATLGWHVHTPFRDFHTIADPGRLDAMTRGALGGLRPLDPSTLQRWRDPVHAERLAHCLRAAPELAGAVTELGYEADDRWTTELGNR